MYTKHSSEALFTYSTIKHRFYKKAWNITVFKRRFIVNLKYMGPAKEGRFQRLKEYKTLGLKKTHLRNI